MSIHGCSFAEYAAMYSQMRLLGCKYLAFRDVPDLLQKYVQGNKALDFGCGHGKSTELLTKLGFIVDGVDINEYMIDLAQKALPKNNFQLIEECKIPAKDEHYDLIFASFVLQDIGPENKLLATLSEIARVLKKEGTFIAITPSETLFTRDWIHVNAESEGNKHLKIGDRAEVLLKESNFILHPFFRTENYYRDMLREAGLDVVLTHEPLGKDAEGFPWMNEKKMGPFCIYVAKKR